MNTGQNSINNHLNNPDTPDSSREVLSKHLPNFAQGAPEKSAYSMQSEHVASQQTELPISGPLSGIQSPSQNSRQSPVNQAIAAAQPLPGPTNPALGHSVAPASAADDDLIEKEWVLRAKAIVAKTKDDPHLQNKELNLYKADYIKKRFNKDIKVSEG